MACLVRGRLGGGSGQKLVLVSFLQVPEGQGVVHSEADVSLRPEPTGYFSALYRNIVLWNKEGSLAVH